MKRSVRTRRVVGLCALAATVTISSNMIRVPTAFAAKAKKKVATGATKSPKATKFTKSTLVWRPCDDPLFQCTELSVPIDPSAPKGATLSLSLVRRPLPAGVKKVGTLLTGSGIPGYSGVRSMKTEVRNKTIANAWARYDVIAFEHRGTGTSSPFVCPTRLTELGLDSFADVTDENSDSVYAKWKSMCVEKNQPLVAHMGVAASVGDIEAIRVALGEPQLSFEFWNHDATIGAAYASKYPSRVRANVMFDPYPMAAQDRFVFDQAQDAASDVERFLTTCQASPACPLSSGDGAKSRLDKLFMTLFKDPVAVSTNPDDGLVGTADVARFIVAMMGDEAQWNSVAAALVALENRDPAPMLNFDSYFTLTVAPLSPSGGPYWAIACADGLFPGSEIEAELLFEDIYVTSPTAAIGFAQGLTGCDSWPTTTRLTEADFRSNVPTLIMSYRGGLPDRWATNAAQLMSSSRVATYGDDAASDTCLERTVTTFLETLSLPGPGTAC